MARLGDLVRDEITGFEGIVLARTEALYEATICRVHRRGLQDNGDVLSGILFEEDRLEVLKENAVVGFRNIVGVEITEEGKGESQCPRNTTIS